MKFITTSLAFRKPALITQVSARVIALDSCKEKDTDYIKEKRVA
jgi:hypothetical protein